MSALSVKRPNVSGGKMTPEQQEALKLSQRIKEIREGRASGRNVNSFFRVK